MTTATPTLLDARDLSPDERLSQIFSTFDALPAGAAMELVNSVDPVPLQQQLKLTRHGQFTWDYLENGPDTWRVRIGKTGQNCCGHCAG